mgnify:CR=1 FL=1
MNIINKSLIPQIVMGDKVYCTDEAARLGLELSQTIDLAYLDASESFRKKHASG